MPPVVLTPLKQNLVNPNAKSAADKQEVDADNSDTSTVTVATGNQPTNQQAPQSPYQHQRPPITEPLQRSPPPALMQNHRFSNPELSFHPPRFNQGLPPPPGVNYAIQRPPPPPGFIRPFPGAGPPPPQFRYGNRPPPPSQHSPGGNRPPLGNGRMPLLSANQMSRLPPPNMQMPPQFMRGPPPPGSVPPMMMRSPMPPPPQMMHSARMMVPPPQMVQPPMQANVIKSEEYDPLNPTEGRYPNSEFIVYLIIIS